MTFSELYRIFFDACSRCPAAKVIATHNHDWEALLQALGIESRHDYGLLEGSITTFTGMTFPVYMVGNVFENYMKLKEERLNTSIAVIHLTLDGDFVQKREVIWCCDNLK